MAVETRNPPAGAREPVAPGGPPSERRPPDEAAGRPTRSLSWIWQVVSGALLLILLTVHMVAQHFVVGSVGGLRDFAQVVAYVSNPVMQVIESLFLLVVTWHAMLGLRSILLDFGFAPRTERRITWALVGLGLATVGYGFWIIVLISSKG